MPKRATPPVDAASQLAAFLAKYAPEMIQFAHHVMRWMDARLRGAHRLIYDNYNALVIAYATGDRASDAVFSIAVYPRWINLFFAHGSALDDPSRLLRGTGSYIRNVKLTCAADLANPALEALIDAALRLDDVSFDASTPGPLIVKSVASAQRARTPSTTRRKSAR